jgi:hypothetical protein
MLADALYKLLASDAGAAVRGQLASYNGAAAVFTTDLPEDCALPAILIAETGGQPWGCRDSEGAEEGAALRVFGDRGASQATLREIAWALWALVNRAALDNHLPAGWEDWGLTAEPPAGITDDAGFPGFEVRASARLLKTG